jgi:hypothetical protein
VQRIALDAEAGQVSAELVRRGIAADTRVHVLVEVASGQELPMAAIGQAGGAFDWLADEPDLYTDADLVPGPGKCLRSAASSWHGSLSQISPATSVVRLS